jgi:hypothetical protein
LLLGRFLPDLAGVKAGYKYVQITRCSASLGVDWIVFMVSESCTSMTRQHWLAFSYAWLMPLT